LAAETVASQEMTHNIDKYLKVRAENSIKQSKVESLKTKRQIDDL